MSQREDRTAWWGTCSNDECMASMIIYPHPDRQSDLPPEDEWEDSTFFIDCPVCASKMEWGGTDPAADLLKNY